MLIRNMNKRDYAAYCSLLCEVHSLHAENRPDIYKEEILLPDEQAFVQMISDENSVSLAADEDGEMIGMCLMQIRRPRNPILHNTPYGWIDDLCVSSAYRGKGVGTMLYQAMKQRAQQMGMSRVELMVWAFNEQAVRFYEKLGLQVRSTTLEEKL